METGCRIQRIGVGKNREASRPKGGNFDDASRSIKFRKPAHAAQDTQKLFTHGFARGTFLLQLDVHRKK